MTAKTDCAQSNDMSSCMTDVQSILTTAEDLYSQATAKQPSLAKILQDVQSLVAEAGKAKTDCFSNDKISDDDMCRKEVESFGAAYKKLWASAKAHKADEMQAELKFMLKDNAGIQSDCHLEGACLKDSQMMQKMVEYMMNMKHDSDNWKPTFMALKKMGGMMKKAEADCQHAPSPQNVCQKDLHMLMADFHKMWGSAKKHDSKAMKAELEFMMKDNTEIQTACHLQDACLKDSQEL